MIINDTWLFFAGLGFVIGILLDVSWWHFKFNKKDKHMAWHEHYHVGLELFFVGLIIPNPIFYGAAFAFFISEWAQKHSFAIGSGHFWQSAVIGLVIGIVIILKVVLF